VLPLRDDNPTTVMPIMTVLLIGATVVVWWSVQGGGLSHQPLAESICRYGVIPVEVTGLAPVGVEGPCALGGLTWEGMLTSIFMHGGWMHLTGNMWFLWIFGNNIEDATGRLRFLAFYLMVGVLAAGAQVIATPASALPMVGASGAVSGVMGAYLVLYPRARVDTLFFFFVFVRVVPLPAWLMLGYWMLLQVFASTLAPEGAGGVAYMAHIGGFAAGILLLPVFRDRSKTKTRRRRSGRGWW
jgi:membrane associated rhomboid family serine protease